MYLQKIILENYGPIELIQIQLPFHTDQTPKPLILIGQNGSGKSIFISHIVNALLEAKGIIYEDREVEGGKVFKYRSPSYIKSGSSYSYSKTVFEHNLFQVEWQLDREKSAFEEDCRAIISDPAFNIEEFKLIDSYANSHINSNFHEQKIKLKNLLDTNCILYFPPNRFEEPGWLNYDNLINKSAYRFHKKLSHLSNRVVINYSPLKDNQNWLLDLLFDTWVLEIEAINLHLPNPSPNKIQNTFPVLVKKPGICTLIHDKITEFLKLLLQTEEPLEFGIGNRRARQVEILKNEQSWIQNIFNLSTGESILLNIFLSIIKDFDLTNAPFTNLSEIRGIVLIDEVDVHLHSNLQYEVLPQLLKLFPKIQFILTSHSPLFLLGLEKQLGKNNFQIINLPDGQEIDVESFSEFEKAYSYFKESLKFQNDIRSEVASSHKDLLFVEGDYDIRYLNRAAELLDKQELLDSFKIIDSGGYGNIAKVSKHFDSKLAEATPQKILLLYDCDIQKPSKNEGNIYIRCMPTVEKNPIKKGIENLFPNSIINKAGKNNPTFFDFEEERKRTVRGVDKMIPALLDVNKDEKKKLCDWIIMNGTKDDFQHFEQVFGILQEIKNSE